MEVGRLGQEAGVHRQVVEGRRAGASVHRCAVVVLVLLLLLLLVCVFVGGCLWVWVRRWVRGWVGGEGRCGQGGLRARAGRYW